MRIIAYSYSQPLIALAPQAESWGAEIDQVYQDLGDRPQLHQLLQDCQNSPPDYLLIRQLAELGDGAEQVQAHPTHLEAMQVQVVAVETAPLSTTLMVLRSMQEQHRSQQIQAGHARSRLKALPPPGVAPYGYRRSRDRYVVDRAAAAIVRDFFDHFLLYGSLRGAVRHVAQKHHKTISVSTGRRWLTSAVYRGDLTYQGGQVILNTHASILSREEGAQIDRLLRRNQRLPPRAASAPRSLSGLVFCASCPSGMTITSVKAARSETQEPEGSEPGEEGMRSEYLYLRPIACPQQPKCRAIPYGQILQQTIERVCADLPRAVSGAGIPDLSQVKGRVEGAIASKQAILDQLPGLVTKGILDQETADLRAYKVRGEMAELQAKLAQLPPGNLRAIAQTVSIPQFWLDLSESERRFYFREFLAQIQIVRQEKAWQIQLKFIF